MPPHESQLPKTTSGSQAMDGKPTGVQAMSTRTKNERKERERYVRQRNRRLSAEAKPAQKHGWGVNQLLAAYKLGQVLSALGTPRWWDLEIHEIDMLFPWNESTVNMLAEDMQCNGYAENCPPIVLFENKVLDGKLRLEAARRAQVTPRFEIFDGEAEAALEYAIRLNRRDKRSPKLSARRYL